MHLPKTLQRRGIPDWEEEHARLQAARRNRRVHEVATGDTDDLKVIVDARLKLEKDLAPAMPCATRETS